jgi:hypothetical protein
MRASLSTDVPLERTIEARVGFAIVAIPAAVVAAGALTAVLGDPRLALLSAAVVLGWTRLVGL